LQLSYFPGRKSSRETSVAIAGGIAVALGLFFMGQALGYIRWPESSFMVNNPNWIYYGGAIVAAGIFLFVLDRR
jgi:hypothetical protein